jgi:hypothetical protein
MGKESKIVDLEMSKDGSYSPKEAKNKSVSKVAHNKREDRDKPKYTQHRDADEFLAGLDAGLDFVENIKLRAIRILGLRD